MIVEFVGLPGAGKTTLHQRAAVMLQSRSEAFVTPAMIAESYRWQPQRPIRGMAGRLAGLWGPAWAKGRRLLFRIETIIAMPRPVGFAVRQVLTSRQPVKNKLYALRLFLVALGNYRRVLQNLGPGHQIVLFDEGVVQRAFAVLVDGRSIIDPAVVRRYAQLIPAPDLLIYLTVNPDIAAARTQGRTRGLPRRYYGLTQEQMRSVMSDAGERLEELVRELQGNVGDSLTVAVIDANETDRAEAEFDARVMPLLTGQNRVFD